jgi:hypothetical protein
MNSEVREHERLAVFGFGEGRRKSDWGAAIAVGGARDWRDVDCFFIAVK